MASLTFPVDQSVCLTESRLEMAASFRFGTTISSQKTVETSQLGKEAGDTEDEKGNFDPDKLLQCPFDKNHQIRSCRFPYHLIKCRKNHPKLASELKTCPFNARHLVPKHELGRHTENCEDRICVNSESGENTNGHCKWQVPVSTWVNKNVTEDWDKEADDSAAPFVWGVSTTFNQNKLEEKPTNSLGPTVRVPNSLPWS